MTAQNNIKNNRLINIQQVVRHRDIELNCTNEICLNNYSLLMYSKFCPQHANFRALNQVVASSKILNLQNWRSVLSLEFSKT